jgi:hypothetical protein
VNEGLTTRRVRVAREDVVLLVWMIEAHDGLANLTHDGDTILVLTPESRAPELDAVLGDLAHTIESLAIVG